MAVSNLHLARTYRNAPEMASRYLEMNGYARIVLDSDDCGETFQVWLMQADTDSGTYDRFDTIDQARAAMETMASVYGLPTEDLWEPSEDPEPFCESTGPMA